jgi:hypothetical protein
VQLTLRIVLERGSVQTFAARRAGVSRRGAQLHAEHRAVDAAPTSSPVHFGTNARIGRQLEPQLAVYISLLLGRAVREHRSFRGARLLCSGYAHEVLELAPAEAASPAVTRPPVV